ncbi:hypothetical protein V7S43_007898 [Phytophthora oleae]|uniref:Crinkler effector protein N-terminal domain-containing protein n=1 Tax=Phytophthora oleae TaxID=2107226 RepID=A0ABD3FKI9_9STRA
MVDDLKKEIKKTTPNLVCFHAALLKLYLTREGNTWLDLRDEDVKTLKAKRLPDRIKHLMQEHLLLEAPMHLNNEACFGNNFERDTYDIRVLVELPDEQLLKYLDCKLTGKWIILPPTTLMTLMQHCLIISEQGGLIDSFVETVDSLVENLFSWRLPRSLFTVEKEKRD